MRLWLSNGSFSLRYVRVRAKHGKKQVQEKLCTEPEETPAAALKFAFIFEDGLKRKKPNGYINQEPKVKKDPIGAVINSISRECWRCSAGNFTLDPMQGTGRNV